MSACQRRRPVRRGKLRGASHAFGVASISLALAASVFHGCTRQPTIDECEVVGTRIGCHCSGCNCGGPMPPIEVVLCNSDQSQCYWRDDACTPKGFKQMAQSLEECPKVDWEKRTACCSFCPGGADPVLTRACDVGGHQGCYDFCSSCIPGGWTKPDASTSRVDARLDSAADDSGPDARPDAAPSVDFGPKDAPAPDATRRDARADGP